MRFFNIILAFVLFVFSSHQTIAKEFTNLQEAMKNPLAVDSLDLSAMKLSEFPVEILQMKNLKCVRLYSNNLTNIPKEIGTLVNLTWLDLLGNQLQTIPAEIGNLKNLTFLGLGFNHITELPTEIGKLENLNFLCMDNNQLRVLPKEVATMNNLANLELNDNQLTELPKEILEMKKLDHVFLGGNQILKSEIICQLHEKGVSVMGYTCGFEFGPPECTNFSTNVGGNMDKIQVSFENKSDKKLNSATFLVIIKNEKKEVVYNQKHIVKLNLDKSINIEVQLNTQILPAGEDLKEFEKNIQMISWE